MGIWTLFLSFKRTILEGIKWASQVVLGRNQVPASQSRVFPTFAVLLSLICLLLPRISQMMSSAHKP